VPISNQGYAAILKGAKIVRLALGPKGTHLLMQIQ
jgi:hypothetical protein